MKIIYHLFLSLFLFFIVLNNIGFSAPLVGSGSETSTKTESKQKIKDNYGEKLSFENTDKIEEVELQSAQDENKKEDSEKTQKELKTNIAELYSDKKHIAKSFNTFISQNGSLKKYFKLELVDSELEEIEKTIVNYNGLRFKAESLLKDKAHRLEDTSIVVSDLLSLKKDLYIAFLPYIEISKLDEYKAFIKADFEATKQDKNIQSDIYKKEKIIEEKKVIIQEKINASEQSLEEKKNKFIEDKISQKLSAYTKSAKFDSLTIEKQKFVFGKVLTKITERRMALEELDNVGSNTKKIKLYKIVEGALEKFISSL